MVKVLVGGEKAKSRLARLFYERLSQARLGLVTKTYPQGGVASFYVNIHCSAKSRTWTSD